MSNISWNDITIETHRRLVREFMRLAADNGFPSRESFLPENVAYALNNLFLSDIENLDGDVRVIPRVVGQNMIDLFGTNLTGVNIIPLLAPKIAQHYIGVFRMMFSTPSLCIALVDFKAKSGLLKRLERLTMPLIRKNGQHSIVASYHAISNVNYVKNGGIEIRAVREARHFTSVDNVPIFGSNRE